MDTSPKLPMAYMQTGYFLVLFQENPVEYEFLRICKELRTKKSHFQVFHGPILRAGNTTEDIGKPAIDIVRMSQKPVMILKGQLHINNPSKFADCMTKRRWKSKKSLTPEQVCEIIQVSKVTN